MDREPPGPRRISIPYTLRALTDPREANLRMVRAYGDPFWVRTVVGPMVVTGDPEGVRAMFTADPDIFEYFAPEMEAPLFGESALVFQSGARHRNDRKLLGPPFHGARMRIYGAAMAEITAHEATKWTRGRVFDMHRAAQTIALRILIRTLFGIESPEIAYRLGEAATATAAAVSPLLLFFPSLRREFGGVGLYARFRRASQRLDALLREQINARRGRTEGRDDILSLMMSARYGEDGSGMSQRRLMDELRVMLFAGHETTAIAIAWAFYWIHRDRSVLDRVLSELRGLGPSPEPDAVAGLPYLDAICQETLRLNPIIPEVTRMLRQPLSVKGYTVPAGVGITAAASLLHYREDLYPEPLRFRPERFLEGRYSPFEHIPFGGGSHRCLGAPFALFEMKIVLSTLLGSFAFRLVKDAPIRAARRGLAVGPRGGVPLLLLGTSRSTHRVFF